MDLWDVVKVMWRRRWVAMPLLVLALVASVFALYAVKPEYKGIAKAGLLSPSQRPADTKPGETPRMNSPWTINSMAEAVTLYMNKAATHRQVETEGLCSTFEVTQEGYGMPIINIEVLCATPELTAATLKRLLGLVDEVLVTEQAVYNLGNGEAITSKVFDDGEEIVKTRTVGKQALIIMLGVGLILAVGVSLLVDSIIKRRQLKAGKLGEARASVAMPLGSAATVHFVGQSRDAITVPIPPQPTPEIAGASAAKPNLDSADDNDRTIVLPLAGVSWTTAKTAKKKDVGGTQSSPNGSVAGKDSALHG